MAKQSRKIISYVIIITGIVIGLLFLFFTRRHLTIRIQQNLQQRYVIKWHPYTDITLIDTNEGVAVDCKAGQGYWLEFQDDLQKPMIVQPGSIQVSIRTLKQTGSIEDEKGIDQTLLDRHYKLIFLRNLHRLITGAFILIVIAMGIIFRYRVKRRNTTNK
ncbi:MAG: hypothetical protein ACOX2M_03205 [Fastidiosipilaceae bacterium]